MQENQGQQTQIGREMPDPSRAATAEEYVAALRALKDWSKLTYRQLSARAEAAGEVLPHSTLAGSLSRTTLPRRDVVKALVRACGCDEEAMAAWMSAYDRAAAAQVAAYPAETGPADRQGPAAEAGGRAGEAAAPDAGAGGRRPGRLRPVALRPRAWAVVGASLSAVLVAGVLVALTVMEDGTGRPAAVLPDRPPVGDVRIRAAHTGMCVTEGRERNGRTDRPLAVQRDCDAVKGLPPRVVLEALGSGVHQIVWVHPEHGPGCLQVDDGGFQDGLLVAPHDCDTTAPHQRFLLEPVGGPGPRRFQVRPTHSGKCLGFVDPMTEEGAEWVQTTCTGTADQEFFVDPA